MSDNAFAYRRSTAFREQLRAHGARHILTPPYTPRTNGKACVLASACRPAGRQGSPRPPV